MIPEWVLPDSLPMYVPPCMITIVFRFPPPPDSRLQTPDSRLQTPDCRLQTPDSRLKTYDDILPSGTPPSHSSYSSPPKRQSIDYRDSTVTVLIPSQLLSTTLTNHYYYYSFKISISTSASQCVASLVLHLPPVSSSATAHSVQCEHDSKQPQSVLQMQRTLKRAAASM